MKETAFTKKFVDCMLHKWPYMWHMKVHGHEMQQAGIADNLFCINSKFVAIEFKIQRDGRISTTPLQMRELNEIKNAKGVSFLIARNELNGKILVRKTRVDWSSLLKLGGKSKKISIKIDWDFEFSKYETAIDLIEVAIS